MKFNVYDFFDHQLYYCIDNNKLYFDIKECHSSKVIKAPVFDSDTLKTDFMELIDFKYKKKMNESLNKGNNIHKALHDAALDYPELDNMWRDYLNDITAPIIYEWQRKNNIW